MRQGSKRVNIARETQTGDNKSNTYHHGDLKAKALALGMEQIEGMDRPDLGLRALARDLDVSATALYRHFPNKDALLDALAMEALNRLRAHQMEASTAVEGTREALEEVGIAYVNWAVANPALVRIIYDRVGTVDLKDGDPSDLGGIFRQLRENIAAVMPSSMSDDERAAAALHTWSLVHGLAMLILDGQVENDPKMIRNVVTMTRIGYAS